MNNNQTIFRKICSCIIFAIVAFSCAHLWNVFFASSRVPVTITSTQNVSTVQKVKPKYKHTRIVDIKVGERVVVSTDNTPKSTSVDSMTWKKVSLYAEETWYDGTVDSINVVTLVPPEWIALHDAKVGSMVPIPLDLQEMGLDENLLAKVQAIEQCPEIRAGPGRVVLTTVNHLSRGVCNLTYTNSAGQSETIRPTASHRFYSLDRKDWIHIGDANKGEKLQGLGNDIITVVSCQPLGKTERVYNMTVENEHVYHVGYLNLLTHNNGCGSWVAEKLGRLQRMRDAYGNVSGARTSNGGTVAFMEMEVDGVVKVFTGRSAHGMSTTFTRVNPITRAHAEGAVVQDALNRGYKNKGTNVHIYVDHPPCGACSRCNGIGSLARELGVSYITVHYKDIHGTIHSLPFYPTR